MQNDYKETQNNHKRVQKYENRQKVLQRDTEQHKKIQNDYTDPNWLKGD